MEGYLRKRKEPLASVARRKWKAKRWYIKNQQYCRSTMNGRANRLVFPSNVSTLHISSNKRLFFPSTELYCTSNLRPCLVWLQLWLELLHSRTIGGASSTRSWSCLIEVFDSENVPSSRKEEFEGELSFLSSTHGTTRKQIFHPASIFAFSSGIFVFGTKGTISPGCILKQ